MLELDQIKVQWSFICSFVCCFFFIGLVQIVYLMQITGFLIYIMLKLILTCNKLITNLYMNKFFSAILFSKLIQEILLNVMFYKMSLESFWRAFINVNMSHIRIRAQVTAVCLTENAVVKQL